MDSPSHDDLRQRLDAFQLDDPEASLTFSCRLARENGWSHPYSLSVIQEYKRFLYLAMTAGHEVTPSDQVDQVWHLHLTYTRSYWGELCGEILGRPLHHGPTKGGKSEAERFEDQYEQTLQSYREAFSEEPPVEIWPPSSVRFDEAAHFVRVNTKHAYVFSKPFVRRRSSTLLMGMAAISTLGLTPALAEADLVVGLGIFAAVCIFFTAVVAALVFGSKESSKKRRGQGGGESGGGFWFGCGGDSGGDGGGDSGCGGSGCGGGCGGGGCGG